MVMTNMYPSDESLARQQELHRQQNEKRKMSNEDYMTGKIIDADYVEVNVSATGDIELLEYKP